MLHVGGAKVAAGRGVESIMRKCVFVLLLVPLATACTPSAPPVASANEPPIEPLVIGKSPPAPIATSDEPPTPPIDDVPVAAGTSSALLVPARDPRIAHTSPRPRRLLVTELQGLESLFTATATASPDRPALMRRLAEDYVELSRGADARLALNAHRSALKYYELLAAEYPKYPQIDEVWYYDGLENELAGNASQARRAYYQLIKTSPQSKLIPLAYFAFGEMFNAEAVNDPSKDDLALQAYAEVLKYPPSGNPVYTDAQGRINAVRMRKLAGSAVGGGAVTRP